MRRFLRILIFILVITFANAQLNIDTIQELFWYSIAIIAGGIYTASAIVEGAQKHNE